MKLFFPGAFSNFLKYPVLLEMKGNQGDNNCKVVFRRGVFRANGEIGENKIREKIVKNVRDFPNF